jgi:hypothetical protein
LCLIPRPECPLYLDNPPSDLLWSEEDVLFDRK